MEVVNLRAHLSCRVFTISVLLLLLATVPSHAADTDMDSFDDAIDVDDDGDGLIEISTLTELNYIRNKLTGAALNDGVNGDNATGCGNGTTVTQCSGYELVNDLDFNTDTSDAVQIIDSKDQFWNGGLGWEPISSGSPSFSGDFDGNNFTIYNLHINRDISRVGLFGETTGSQISNVHFRGDLTSVVGGRFSTIGTLAGNVGSNFGGPQSTITNCSAITSVEGGRVGGLLGSVSLTIVSNSYSAGQVIGVGLFAGGLIGELARGTLIDSYSTATVSSSGRAGGLVGSLNGLTSFVGTVFAGTIRNSFASGNVSTSGLAGGLVAQVGGGFGDVTNIENAFASGDVEVIGNSSSTRGGLVGQYSQGTHTLSNTFATGTVTETTGVQGGLIGGLGINQAPVTNLTISDAYWDTQTTGQPLSFGAEVGVTTEQLKCPKLNSEDCLGGGALYTNWPDTVWDFGLEIQYPAIIVDGVVFRDSDGDGELDQNDSNDDNDDFPDVTDLCPFDPDAQNQNNDGDALCDLKDLDDDNDGYSDIDEASNGGQSDPNNAASLPSDNDGDFVSDFVDPDDDNDGYTDVDELSNGGQSDPLDAGSVPPDADGDFISDFNDDDADNDGVLNVDDNCVLDPDPANLNNDGDELCDFNDPDDDDDTVEDGSDNCQFVANLDQANNDGDEEGDLCDDNDDNDSFPDDIDLCPFDFSNSQFDQDGDGLPGACDVDEDGDQLIELRSLSELDLVRDSLDGSSLAGDSEGCSISDTLAACIGFEMIGANSLFDFNTDQTDAVQVIDSKDQFWNEGQGWIPIGDEAAPFTAVFEGNSARIRNLFIQNTDASRSNIGLFGKIVGGAVRGLVFQNEVGNVASDIANSNIGVVAGSAEQSTIEDIGISGDVQGAANSNIGGAIGKIDLGSTVSGVYANGNGSSSDIGVDLGGLVGELALSSPPSNIENSHADYALSTVAGSLAGGLVARSDGGTVNNSYALGSHTGGGSYGGLIGDDSDSSNVIDSYWNSDLAIGSDGGTPKTISQLQCVPQADFNLDCEGGGQLFANWAGNNWHLGTTFQYPVRILNFNVQRDSDGDGQLDDFDSDPDGDGFIFGDDNCPFDPDPLNVNSDDDDRCDQLDLDDDNDGYSDADETDNGTSLVDANDVPADNDGDFVSDLNDLDDDNDGNLDTLDNCVFDADVANQNFDNDDLCDTNDADDDNDGVTDVDELLAGLNPFDPNDVAIDSDGDGFSDGQEASSGSDLNDPLSTPFNAGAGVNEWKTQGPFGGTFGKVFVDPNDANTAYGLNNAEVFRTRDRGLSWSKITSSIPLNSFPLSFTGLAIDPNSADTLYLSNTQFNGVRMYKTVDGGLNWSAAESGFTQAPTGVFADPISSSNLYAIRGLGEIYRTVDAGLNWVQISTVPISDSSISNLYIARSNPAVFYTYSANGVFVSSDGGLTWDLSNTGIVGPDVINSLVVDPSNADIAYVFSRNNGLFRTTDRGLNWVRADTVTSTVNLRLEDLVIDANAPSTLYAQNFTRVYKSIDSGDTWLEVLTGLPSNITSRALAISVSNPSVLYFMDGSSGPFVTSDGAENWVSRMQGVTLKEVDGLVYLDDSNRLVSGSRLGNPVIEFSQNAGGKWQPSIQGVSENRVFSLAADPNNSDVVYAGTSNTIYKSIDGAQTWQDTDIDITGAFENIAIDPQNSSIVYATSLNRGVVVSTDAGLNWNIVTVGIPENAVNGVSDVVVGDTAAYVSVSFGTGSRGVYKSTNNGAIWVAVNTGDLAGDIRINSLEVDIQRDRIYAISNVASYRTQDQGASWSTLVGAQGGQAIAIDKFSPNILYTGSPSRFQRSADDGLSWQELPDLGVVTRITQLVSGPQGSSIFFTATRGNGVHAIELSSDMEVSVAVTNMQILEGGEISYELNVTNNGPFDESGASVSFTLPTATSFTSASPEQGSCSHISGTVNCELGGLANGASTSMTVLANVTRVSSLRATATVSSYLNELDASNNQAISTEQSIADTDGDGTADIDDLNDDNDAFDDVNDNCSLIVNDDQADFDGDGAGDVCDNDDDGDGISDFDELRNGLNPLDASDATLDNDGDGLNNRREIQLRTDPNDADSDDDGTPDGVEVAAGTNPNRDESKPIILAPLNLLLLDD